jgi:hypothetical protein
MFNKYRHNSSQGTGKIRIGAIAIALTAMLLPACANNEQAATPDNTTEQTDGAGTPLPVQEAENVTAGEISQKTSKLLGQFVTVRSEPIQKVGEHTFTISDSEVFGGERIIVVNATGEPLVLPEPQDAELQVTGTVAKFVAADIEREYGWDLDPNVYKEYESQPALIAQSIALAPTPGEIAEQPQTYYNKVISVHAEVENIYNQNAFILDNDALLGTQDLLVIVPENIKRRADFQQGSTIVVTGDLRQFVVADIERDYNFVWDDQLRTRLEKEYSQRPVLIAKGIYPSALPESAK